MDGCPAYSAGESWRYLTERRSLLWLALSRGQVLGVLMEASPRVQGFGLLLDVDLGLGFQRSLGTRDSW